MLDPANLDDQPELSALLDHDALAGDPDSDVSHRSGGPNTPEGKARSSRNSLKHGCRSNILILDDEKQEDFDALHARWLDAYQPDTEAALELVEQLVLEKWYLLRNERRLAEVEFQLSHFPFTKWNEGQHKIYQLTVRYKTAAFRAASKAQRDLEDYLKNRRAEDKYRQQLNEDTRTGFFKTQEDLDRCEMKLEREIEDAALRGIDVTQSRAELADLKKKNRAKLAQMRENISALEPPKTRAQMMFQGQNSPKKLRRIPALEQWVEVTIKDGVTETSLTPSNEKLIQRGQTMDPPPELVYRRINFPHGVPDEYDWTTDDPILKQYGGCGLQRMTVDTWLDVIDAEKLRGDGHIGPCGNPLPRPKEHGECDCPRCKELTELLAARSSSPTT